MLVRSPKIITRSKEVPLFITWTSFVYVPLLFRVRFFEGICYTSVSEKYKSKTSYR